LPSDQSGLVVGREGIVHLSADSVGCVDQLMLRDSAGKELRVDWKPVKPDVLEVKVPLEDAAPGPVALVIAQYGAADTQKVTLNAFTEAAHLSAFTLYAGDAVGMLKGTRLDEVAALTLNGIAFSPGSLERLTGPASAEELPMMASDVQAASALKPGEAGAVRITLKDGRRFGLEARIEDPRPSATLIAKNIQSSQAGVASHIALSDSDQLPQDAVLVFSIRTAAPQAFSRTTQLEVATVDGAFSSLLSTDAGTVMLADARVAVARLDPAKAFGPSAYGPLRFRVVQDGVPGSWAPLATLVRLPRLLSLECPATADVACRLSGTDLFLIDAISADRQFHTAVQVPDGFPGGTLPVPHPAAGELFIRLRDDPATVNAANLGAQLLPVAPASPLTGGAGPG
jgi:hypothetical protein